ncbi:MAG TPA: DEAD/DEAH box helicase [Ktedonobacteraceae bacterium]|nr:DEAD/DEAH box helicase [Ktedonobacteraceae bacterium]
MLSFYDFSLQPSTQTVLADMQITEPTPIQAEAIPVLLAGNDLVGQSITGSGKTLAYGIPLVERIARDKRVVQALVLVPTRELAIQVNTVLSRLASSRRITTALLVGGRAYGSQISALRYGSQIVVGTPGRVKDHLDRGTLVLDYLRICILDEADQMLDSGFAPAIEEILKTSPDTRQTALFSATIPDWVVTLQQNFLKNPVSVTVHPSTGEQSAIEQIAYQVPQAQKMAALCTLLRSSEGESSLIFGKTKYGVEKLGKQLSKLGFAVGTLHGNKSQHAREEVLTAFRRGHVQTLLATNVAARGLDIQGIYQVINYELPESSELFTHRIGRTGRMGRQGKAITLLVPSDVPRWRRMARDLGQTAALQRLAIDEEAMGTIPGPRQEISVMQEHKQNIELESESNRNHSSPDQERGRSSRSKQDSYPASGARRRSKERISSKTSEYAPARQPEDFPLPERSHSGGVRRGRGGAGKQSNFARTAGKHTAHAFIDTEPQRHTARRKSRVAPALRTQRASVSNRSARLHR